MTSRIRKALAWSAAALLASDSLAFAQGLAPKPASPAPSAPVERDVIPIGRSISIEVPRDVGIARTTDEKVANVIPVTARRVEVLGVGAGQTDVKLFDTAGRPMLTQTVRVEPDFGELSRLIASRIPGAEIEIDSLNGKVVLNGTVPTNAAIDRAVQLASAVAGGKDNVVNFLSSTGNDQVMLKIEVVEVSRNSIKQMGFDTNVLFGQLGTDQWGIGNSPTFGVNGGFQGGFSGGFSRNTTSQPVGNSPLSLFGKFVDIPLGSTGITPGAIGQFVDRFLRGTGGALSADQTTWIRTYLNQYAPSIQVVDSATNATYTMADVGISAANLPAQYQAYLNGTSALSAHGNEWMRLFANSLPDFNNAYYNSTANPTSTFIDRSNPANPVATNRVGSAGVNQARNLVQAFERVGLIRTIAEPSGTVISGQTHKFTAGGQFPVPQNRDRDGNVTYDYKDYGVGMEFSPVVLSSGRISLKIKADVSDLTSVGSQTITSATGSTTLPGIVKRSAETTVEMPAGGSIVLSGLLQDTTRENIDKVPGISEIPVLGALSRSRDYLGGQTELVIIATVVLVHPVSRNQLQTPADGLQIATDLSTVLVGRLNRTYNTPPEAVEGRKYEGPFGHVID